VERRSEPRLESQRTVVLTLLKENGIELPAQAIEMSGTGMRVFLNRAIPVGATVKVETDDSMMLGEVCHCATHVNGFLAGLVLHQVLSKLGELARLNERMMGKNQVIEFIKEPCR
jgi:hypothetical protein